MSWITNIFAKRPAAPVVTTRAVDVAFTPHATRSTFVAYTLALLCNEGETLTVELRCDAASPPTVVRASAHFAPGAAAGASAACRQQLTYLVPAGHNVLLVTSGTGTTPTIAHQVEVVAG
jgi:hypothetical protein